MEINESKTKHMKIGGNQGKEEIELGKDTFENVSRFKILGVTVSRTGDRLKEINEKIQ